MADVSPVELTDEDHRTARQRDTVLVAVVRARLLRRKSASLCAKARWLARRSRKAVLEMIQARRSVPAKAARRVRPRTRPRQARARLRIAKTSRVASSHRSNARN